MPRPKLPDDQRRTVDITVAFTAAQAATLRERARATGLRVADIVRLGALNAPAPRAVRTLDAQLLRQLGGIASNINQLTHAAHATRSLDVAPLLVALTDVRATLEATKEALLA